jgi:SAM-dependent methyltransferase
MGDPTTELDYGLNWICGDGARVLHFGCGDGDLLRRCAAGGTQIHIGIDPSPKLISKARRMTEASGQRGAKYYFRCGGAAELKALLPDSFDAVIIWGAVDDLSREDGEFVLCEMTRALAKKGKALLKLGGHDEQGSEVNFAEMPVLWNLTVAEWTKRFEESFIVKPCRDIYNREKRRHEAVFLLQKPDGITVKKDPGSSPGGRI